MSSSSVVTRSGAQKTKIQTRSMIKEIDTRRKPSSALLEAKKKAKKNMSDRRSEEIIVKDIFQNAVDAMKLIRGDTGLIYDERMSEHRCLWDENYPEKPERFTRVIERCSDLKLIERCKRIPSRMANKEEILLKHTEAQYDLLKSTSGILDETELEDISSYYDAIYIHPTTFDLSLLSVGSTIELVKNIVNGNMQNGMAVIRPPGHHAMKSEFNGYCFFNNVAIAAQYALDNLKLSKILIVDWDVHHGQGTQRMFYDDPRVLYFSIHRFEYGTFWPNLRESDFDYIGEGFGRGFNFNLPLNQIGMKNGDYMAIFQQILIPVAMEFCPELVIVSAGYDSAIGDEKGEMEITPAFYPHLLSPLLALAQGRVAVVLEGGYCLESLADGAALTLRTLLGDPCPKLENLDPPSDSIQESILNCINSHRPFWKCIQIQKTYTLEELNNVNPQPNLHKVIQTFKERSPVSGRFETRDCYPIQNETLLKAISSKLLELRLSTKLDFPSTRVCFVYDDIMMEHQNMFEDGHPEHPDRIKKIQERHIEYDLFSRMEQIKPRHATTDELCLAHTRSHVNFIRRTVQKEGLREIGDTYNSVYFHPKTFECATLAAGSVLQVVDDVLNGNARSGICIVRPPGHHAESDLPHGFCIFNNVAVAAQYAIRDHGLKRVLIIDWDVHHGNGTQHIFESNSNVLYISIHRYDNGSFFPKSKDADYNVIGTGGGEGFNVNIPWNKKGMGDMEYILAFQNVVMPIAYEFNPELVLISAGFDAAIGDPLGGCKVTPEAYGYFTHWLSALANGKIIICLEGGYNVNSISYAMTMCSKSLLGDPLPILNSYPKSAAYFSCIETLQNVLLTQQKFWKCMKFHKKLPELNKTKTNAEICELLNELKIKTCADNDQQNNSRTSNKQIEGGAAGGSDNNQPGTSQGHHENNHQTLNDFLKDNLEALVNEDMFAIVPLKTCPHLSHLEWDNPPLTINTKLPCSQCGSRNGNWICLICFETLCGRYVREHMLFHHFQTQHPLVLSFSDLSVWCYICEAYIDNAMLYKYKNLAHIDKFGEELTWSYGNDIVFVDELIH